MGQWRAACGIFASKICSTGWGKTCSGGKIKVNCSLDNVHILYVLDKLMKVLAMVAFYFFWSIPIHLNIAKGIKTNIPMIKLILRLVLTLALIMLLLFMAGIELNPGPPLKAEKDCKGHQSRLEVSKELSVRQEQSYVASHVRDRKVFKVSIGPQEQVWSLRDFEDQFTKGLEWKRMQKDVWIVPTMNLVSLEPNHDNPHGRLTPDETTDDMEQYLRAEFEKQCNLVKKGMSEKEKRKTDPSKLEAKIRSSAIKLTERNEKASLYKQRLGDIAEIRVIDALRTALTNVPSLIIRGVNNFKDFPNTLEEAGIVFSDKAEHDIIVLIPRGDILCVRYIEVKRQIVMPWDKKGRTFHVDLVKKMYQQLQKDIRSFFELFPDFYPHQVDLQVLGALPFTETGQLFCHVCKGLSIDAGKVSSN